MDALLVFFGLLLILGVAIAILSIFVNPQGEANQ